MNADSIPTPANRLTQFLAVLSVATFWLLPLSPFISMAALSKTKQTTGWTRTLAVTATVLCTAFTLWMASLAGYLIMVTLTELQTAADAIR